ARIRCIFLDGYGILVFRIVIFKISTFKLQNTLFDVINSDDEMDGPELIVPYKAMGSPNAPPPKSDNSSGSEFEAAPATSVVTITKIPPTGRKFPGSTHIMGEPSSAAPVSYHPEELMPSTLRRDIDSL
ncbi:hypothetical protein Tco_1372440, partial [Tanacetum coccineum]